jgi:hypothetical protein
MEVALFEAPALKAERAAVLVRKSVVDMIEDVNCCNVDTASIGLFAQIGDGCEVSARNPVGCC